MSASGYSSESRNFRLLIAGTVVVVSGYSVVWPLTTIYVHDHLGESMTVAGIVLMIQSAAGLIGNLIGGHLFDVLGGRRTIVLGAATASLSALLMGLWHTFGTYLALMLTLGLGVGLIYPCLYAYAATAGSGGGRSAFNSVYVAQNVGVATGAFVGGYLAQIGFSLSFEATAVFFVAFLALVVFAFRGSFWEAEQTPPREPAGPGGLPAPRTMGVAPWLLAAGLFVDWVAYVQWQTSVSAHMQALGFPLSSYSLLWTINGAVILLGQPLVRAATRYFPSLKSQILIGNVLFFAAFLTLIHNRSYSGFLLAMLLTTFGEMLVYPGIPAAADLLATRGRRGLYQGLVSGAASMGRMMGPLLGGLLYDHYPTSVLFTVMASLFLLGFLVLSQYDRWMRTQPAVPDLPSLVP